MFYSKKKIQTNLEKHQEESAKAFDVFNQTVDNLKESNLRIEESISIEEATILEASYNKDKMEIIQARNTKLIDKITEFFEL
jgi:hypothetical protein